MFKEKHTHSHSGGHIHIQGDTHTLGDTSKCTQKHSEKYRYTQRKRHTHVWLHSPLSGQMHAHTHLIHGGRYINIYTLTDEVRNTHNRTHIHTVHSHKQTYTQRSRQKGSERATQNTGVTKRDGQRFWREGMDDGWGKDPSSDWVRKWARTHTQITSSHFMKLYFRVSVEQ